MKIFISYSFADQDLAEGLAQTLKSYGLQAWRQDADIMPGDNWAEKYGQALENADAMVVIVSRASEQDSNLIRDISFAISEKQFKNRLIPLYSDRPSKMNTNALPWPLKKMSAVVLPDYSSRQEAFDTVAQMLKSKEATV